MTGCLLTTLLFANGCSRVIRKSPAESGCCQPVVIAQK